MYYLCFGSMCTISLSRFSIRIEYILLRLFFQYYALPVFMPLSNPITSEHEAVSVYHN